MSAVQDTARALAAQVAYPSDGNRASKWMPHTRATPVEVVPSRPRWTLIDAARALGVETPSPVADWYALAECAGCEPGMFFPDPGVNIGHVIRDVCSQCPVRAHCLQHAMNADELFGVWGGTNENERRTLRVGQSLAAGRPIHPGRVREPINHGGVGGYSTHMRRGESPCDACKEAHNAANATRRRKLRKATS